MWREWACSDAWADPQDIGRIQRVQGRRISGAQWFVTYDKSRRQKFRHRTFKVGGASSLITCLSISVSRVCVTTGALSCVCVCDLSYLYISSSVHLVTAGFSCLPSVAEQSSSGLGLHQSRSFQVKHKGTIGKKHRYPPLILHITRQNKYKRIQSRVTEMDVGSTHSLSHNRCCFPSCRQEVGKRNTRLSRKTTQRRFGFRFIHFLSTAWIRSIISRLTTASGSLNEPMRIIYHLSGNYKGKKKPKTSINPREEISLLQILTLTSCFSENLQITGKKKPLIKFDSALELWFGCFKPFLSRYKTTVLTHIDKLRNVPKVKLNRFTFGVLTVNGVWNSNMRWPSGERVPPQRISDTVMTINMKLAGEKT